MVYGFTFTIQQFNTLWAGGGSRSTLCSGTAPDLRSAPAKTSPRARWLGETASFPFLFYQEFPVYICMYIYIYIYNSYVYIYICN